MGKKYLLTFSLAAISCLATKSIQEVLVIEDKNEQVEITNNKNSEINIVTEVNLETELNIY